MLPEVGIDKGGAHAAVIARVGRTAGIGVVDGGVHGLADQFLYVALSVLWLEINAASASPALTM